MALRYLYSIVICIFVQTILTNFVNSASPGDDCQKIDESSFCSQGISYNLTALPNSLGHNEQAQVLLALKPFSPLILSECSQYLRLFLCSVYFPVCVGLYKPIFPCRSLCQKARSSCKSMIKSLNFDWPDHLSCSEFPSAGLCINEENIKISLWVMKAFEEIEIEKEFGEGETEKSSENFGINRISVDEGKCEKISLPLCNFGLPYTEAIYPNLIGHDSQEDVWRNMIKYEHLAASDCSEHLRFFLCVVHAPMCTLLSTPIPPCRSLCRKVKNECKDTFRDLEILWPDNWACKNFPTTGICLGERDNEIDWFWRRRVSAAAERWRFQMFYQRHSTTTLSYKGTSDRETTTKEKRTDSMSNAETETVVGSDSTTVRPVDEISDSNPNIPVQTLGNCENVREPLCSQDIPYNWTTYPNTLGHMNQEAAGQDLHQFEHLLKSRRSINLRLFLCSVFVPVCTVFAVPMPPCQSLCEKAKEYFNSMTKNSAESWPDHLQCYQFPLFGLCFAEIKVEDIPTTVASQLPDTSYDKQTETTEKTTGVRVRFSTISTSQSPQSCQNITIPLCQGLQYNQTFFPNLLGHMNGDIAGREISRFEKLIKTGCSKHLRFFLCIFYSPVCTVLEEVIPPCREICEITRDECSTALTDLGISWPSYLDCNEFPTGGLCIGVPETEVGSTPKTVTTTVQTIVTSHASTKPEPQGCRNITIPICQGLQYNQTFFPNLLGHMDGDIAGREMNRFEKLVKTGCSKHLRFFLCIFFSPVCTILEEAIPPCREICETTRDECSATLTNLGMSWPSYLECNKFPTGGLCIDVPETEVRELPPSISTPKIVKTTQAIVTSQASTKPEHGCRNITIPLCQGLQYNQTFFPNLLGHMNGDIAGREMSQFEELVKTGCSKHLRFFLCIFYSPVCTVLEEVISPCREICEITRDECSTALTDLGISWPGYLDCNEFPTGGLCIGVPETEVGSTPKTVPTTVQTIVTSHASTKPEPQGCRNITIPLCQGLQYNQTFFPNLLGHMNGDIAGREMSRFEKLVKTGCSKHLRFFLCIFYSPLCTVLEEVIPPCREICEKTRDECSTALTNLGISWPSYLECNEFPTGGLCIGVPETKVGSTPKIVTTTVQTIVTSHTSTKPEPQGCRNITIPLCQGLQYNQTFFPNLLGHMNGDIAGREMSRFEELVKTGCSKHLRFFLCIFFSPVCTILEEAIPPCREICETTRDECSATLTNLGMSWPRYLECNKFPTGGLCIGVSEEDRDFGQQPNTVLPSTISTSTTEPPHVCQLITVSFCREGIPYNDTIMPNLLGHSNQMIVQQELAYFEALINSRCSRHMTYFLCSVFTPVCTVLLKPIPPCRPLCEKTVNDCQSVISNLGLSWPNALMCDRFPRQGLCVGEDEDANEDTKTTKHPDDTDKIAVDKRHSSIKEPITTPTDMALSSKQCQEITIHFCSDGLSYSMTSYPNLLGHKNQDEAFQALSEFEPLLGSECSVDLKIFLCHLHTPMCIIGSRPLPPCRFLCLQAKKSCRRDMRKKQIVWPESLHCENFPESGFCIGKIDIKRIKAKKEKPVKGAGKLVASLSDDCEHIRHPICYKSLPYSVTRFPNFLSHGNHSLASREMDIFKSLLDSECSSHLGVFLCATHFPVCIDSSNPLPPCRSLCRAVRNSCRKAMKRVRFKWPQNLQCRNFPVSGFCIGEVEDIDSKKLIWAQKTEIPTEGEIEPKDKVENIKIQCQVLSKSVCSSNVPYNKTYFPNSIGLENQDEAETMVQLLIPLKQYECNRHLSLFVCSSYFPKCGDFSNVRILPCRSLCEHVKNDCQALFDEFGVGWPEELQCHHFSDKDPCIKEPNQEEIFPIVTIKESGREKEQPEIEKQKESNKENTNLILPRNGCERITIPMCQDNLLYNMTSFPNSLQHETQEDASIEIDKFSNLVESECNKYFRMLMCIVYLPPCTVNSSIPIVPCRSWCEKIKNECGRMVTEAVSIWPTFLKCDDFPESGVCLKEDIYKKEIDKKGEYQRQIGENSTHVSNFHGQCEPVMIQNCHKVFESNTGSFSSSLQRMYQENNSPEAQEFLSFQVQCGSYSMSLCIMFDQPCEISSPSLTLPCQSMCEKARAECETFLSQFKFDLPSSWTCDYYLANTSCSKEHRQEVMGPIGTAATVTSHETSTRITSPQRKCERIEIAMCRDNLPYNMTLFPNSLQHMAQKDANLEIRQFRPLVKSLCSKYLKLFLCTIYVPPCNKNASDSIIGPCRSLCEKAKFGCKAISKKFGLTWPSVFRCENFPKSGSCINEKAYLASSIKEKKNSGSVRHKKNSLKGRQSNGQCEDITIRMCRKNLPYHMTSYPNSLGHLSQENAGVEIRQYFSLVKLRCSKYFRQFLCTVFAPPCANNSGSLILPCRSFCEKVKYSCKKIMSKFGFPWPSSLQCENFPESGICMSAKGYKKLLTLKSVTGKKAVAKDNMKPKKNSTITFKPNQIKCERITIPLCLHGLPYNKTRYPNLLDQTNQIEAGFEIHQFSPLVKSKCSEHIKLFLCSIYAPPCVNNPDVLLPPCRSLCKKVTEDCGEIMNNFGLVWPSFLQCNNFVESEFCIKDGYGDFRKKVKEKAKTKLEIRNNDRSQCEQITIPLCIGILPYNTTAYPNTLNHANQIEAGLEIHLFFPLIVNQCSNLLQLFLCSVYGPPCGNYYSSKFFTCRSMCEKVKDDCKEMMKSYGFEWPSYLRCENFPESDTCIQGNKSGESSISETNEIDETTGSESQGELSTNIPKTFNKCEPITIPLCLDGLPYNMTTFPNSLRHKSQEEANLGVHQFSPLIESECSSYLQLFLCIIFTPPCENRNNSLTLPCRSLCEKAKDDCHAVLIENGFDWPRVLRCETFPDSGDCFDDTAAVETKTKLDTPTHNVCKDMDENENEDSLFLRPYHESCEIITTDICIRDIPYNITSFPNSLWHESQSEASVNAKYYLPLSALNHSLTVRLFFCSVYFPPCAGNDDVILPCRSLCEVARKECMEFLINTQYMWPECFQCHLFPESSPCLGENTTIKIENPEICNKGVKKPVCEVLNISLCEDSLAHNMTYFPNSLSHKNQRDARHSLERFFPLVKIGCSKEMGRFLCSIHAPPCSNLSNSMIFPCRSLCEKVRTDCQTIMNKYGFVWPDDLRCDRLPENDLCFGIEDENGNEVSGRTIELDKKNISTVTTTESENIEMIAGNGNSRQVDEAENVKRCQTIKLPFCQGDLQYDMTAFPNSFGHSSQEKAAREFHKFYPLIEVECSEHLRRFLCSSYIPMCLNDTGSTISPCRSMCEKAQEDCYDTMKNLGFPWPNSLRCDQFPTYGPCVGERGIVEYSVDKKPEVQNKVEEYAKKDLTRENCRAITIPFCRGELPYYQTSFPNALGHSSQEEASRELYPFYPLVEIECSRNLRLFLCSALIPPCENSVIMLPCRSLCEIAKNRCRRNIDESRFEWSEALRCDHFPTSGSCVREEEEEEEEEIEEEILEVTTASQEEIEETATNEGIGTETKKTDILEKVKTGKEVETLNPYETVGPRHQCSNIRISLCRDGIPYNMTSFPNNLAGFVTQKEATVQIRKFYPLIKARCSKHLHLMLCSVFAPKCTRDRQYMPPCRSLCRKARKECRDMLKKFGIRWPGVLQCKRFTDDMPCLQ